MNVLMNHIPKCAGNAVARQFEALLGVERTYEIRTQGGIEAVPDLAPYAFVFGHLPFDWDEKLGIGRQRFTLMRNPVTRVLSAYFFFDQLQRSGSGVVANCPPMTLEAFVTSDAPQIMATTCNEQARHVLGLEGPGTREPAEAAAFVAGRMAMLERFFSIGLYERLQDSLDAVCWHLRLPRMRAGLVENRTHRNWKLDEIAPAVIEAIRERNLIDLELYRVVSARFEQARAMMMEDLLSDRYFGTVPVQPALPCVLEMGGTVTGSGWYGAEADERGQFRWMGGPDGASLYFNAAGGGDMLVTLSLLHMAPNVGVEDISLYLDGQMLSLALTPGDEGRCTLVGHAAGIFLRKGHVLSLSTRTWREPTEDDGRLLALGVERAVLEARR
ncbi:hypothetical protein [Acidocella sp.]|uniref:hypothetical protein n=1 Tax=Acidocella sp. TaxID=50710 RepID=UPI00260F35EC|nr:hypothetical protein [Acidocella sp.]